MMAALGGTLAGIVATTQVAGPLVAQETKNNAGVYEQLDLFGDIFERIRAQYVEEVEAGELIEAAIDGMLTSLDPHSSYLSPDDAEQMRVQTRGEFGGLGIEVTQEEGFVKVVSPMDGTPADKAGIQPGDLIIRLDGKSVKGLTRDEAVQKMRGEKGTPIDLTLIREGASAPIELTITREDTQVSEEIIKVVNESGRWNGEVVTTLEPYTKFWPAEESHQDYLVKYPNGYTCHFERFGTFLD